MRRLVDDFLADLRRERRASRHTIASYRSDLEGFFAWLAAQRPAQAAAGGDAAVRVSTQDLRSYLGYLGRRGYARRTSARKLSCLRSFFDYLHRVGEIPANPGQGLKGPRTEPLSPRDISLSLLEQLLALPDPDDPLGQRDAALLETLYATGMRVSELVALNVSDIDLGEGWAVVAGPAGRARVIPLGSKAALAISRYLSQGRRELCPPQEASLFVNRRGGRLTDRSVRRLLEGYARRLPIQLKVTPQTLRHSFALHLLTAGADVAAVQEMLGHRSAASTLAYLQRPGGEVRLVYRQSHPRA